MAAIHLKVQPRSSRNRVEEFRDGVLRIRVVAPPEDGKANAAVIALVSERLGISLQQLRIVRGAASRDKVVEVDGLEPEELLARLVEKV